MNLIQDEMLELIQPPCVNPFYGVHTVKVAPRSDLDEDQTDRYWRLFGKYPNDFAAAVNKLLPATCRLVSFDHLSNTLTYEQRTHSSNL